MPSWLLFKSSLTEASLSLLMCSQISSSEIQVLLFLSPSPSSTRVLKVCTSLQRMQGRNRCHEDKERTWFDFHWKDRRKSLFLWWWLSSYLAGQGSSNYEFLLPLLAKDADRNHGDRGSRSTKLLLSTFPASSVKGITTSEMGTGCPGTFLFRKTEHARHPFYKVHALSQPCREDLKWNRQLQDPGEGSAKRQQCFIV